MTSLIFFDAFSLHIRNLLLCKLFFLYNVAMMKFVQWIIEINRGATVSMHKLFYVDRIIFLILDLNMHEKGVLTLIWKSHRKWTKFMNGSYSEFSGS